MWNQIASLVHVDVTEYEHMEELRHDCSGGPVEAQMNIKISLMSSLVVKQINDHYPFSYGSWPLQECEQLPSRQGQVYHRLGSASLWTKSPAILMIDSTRMKDTMRLIRRANDTPCT